MFKFPAPAGNFFVYNRDMHSEKKQKIYAAIDLKSFYASVECVDRGLDPLTTNLVVADITRTEKTICLAVSPSLKALGIPGRARLFEVMEKARGIDIIIAPPRMQRYADVSNQIIEVYNSFVAGEDMHIYSIDEVFLDLTSYLKTYNQTPEELVRNIVKKILEKTGITATAGIGTNMYLAKVAMDIVAKHLPADENGVRIATLDEKSYRQKLWSHTPLTDFWRIGRGIGKRLENLGIKTMGDLAKYSITGYDKLYREFGVNAELIIDHAWGHEPVEIKDIKGYQAQNHSLSIGQVLSRAYNIEEAEIILKEMLDDMSLRLTSMKLKTDQIVLDLAKNDKTRAHGSVNLGSPTSSAPKITSKTIELYHNIVGDDALIRRINIAANHVKSETSNIGVQLDFFTDYELEKDQEERQERLQEAALKIQAKYGKNAILKAIDLEEGATRMMRNRQIGGHAA